MAAPSIMLFFSGSSGKTPKTAHTGCSRRFDPTAPPALTPLRSSSAGVWIAPALDTTSGLVMRSRRAWPSTVADARRPVTRRGAAEDVKVPSFPALYRRNGEQQPGAVPLAVLPPSASLSNSTRSAWQPVGGESLPAMLARSIADDSCQIWTRLLTAHA